MSSGNSAVWLRFVEGTRSPGFYVKPTLFLSVGLGEGCTFFLKRFYFSKEIIRSLQKKKNGAKGKSSIPSLCSLPLLPSGWTFCLRVVWLLQLENR